MFHHKNEESRSKRKVSIRKLTNKIDPNILMPLTELVD